MLFRQILVKFEPELPKLEPIASIRIKEDKTEPPRKKGCKCIQ